MKAWTTSMEYIGFYFVMIGMAALGGALDMRGDMLSAAVMAVAGAEILRLYRKGDEDSEEKDTGIDLRGNSFVDKPAGEGGGGYAADSKCGGGRSVSDHDHSILSWKYHCDRTSRKAGHLCSTRGVDR